MFPRAPAGRAEANTLSKPSIYWILAVTDSREIKFVERKIMFIGGVEETLSRSWEDTRRRRTESPDAAVQGHKA